MLYLVFQKSQPQLPFHLEGGQGPSHKGARRVPGRKAKPSRKRTPRQTLVERQHNAQGYMIPQPGDEVFRYAPGAFGSEAVVHGEVYRTRAGHLRVRLTGAQGMLGAHVSAKSAPLTESWRVIGDPLIAEQERKAAARRKRQQQEFERDAKESVKRLTAYEEEQRQALATAGLTPLTPDTAKPGDSLRHINDVAATDVVVKVEGDTIYTSPRHAIASGYSEPLRRTEWKDWFIDPSVPRVDVTVRHSPVDTEVLNRVREWVLQTQGDEQAAQITANLEVATPQEIRQQAIQIMGSVTPPTVQDAIENAAGKPPTIGHLTDARTGKTMPVRLAKHGDGYELYLANGRQPEWLSVYGGRNTPIGILDHRLMENLHEWGQDDVLTYAPARSTTMRQQASRPSATATRQEEEPSPLETWKKELASLKRRKRLTASEEAYMAVLERRVKAKPSQWKVGQGVSWAVQGQTNRGFRIAQVDRKQRLALITSIADTGLTLTGSERDAIPSEWVPLGDLRHDRRYDAPNGGRR